MNPFIITYWAAMVIEIIIRMPYQKKWKEGEKSVQQITTRERAALGLLLMGMGGFPLIYSLTDWLDFADYTLPAWMGILGIVLMACALFVFARAHKDLQANWSPSLEIRADHTLITNGIYRYIRHPMYASQWLWILAQIFLLQNWIAGPLHLPIFLIFYLVRVPAEEKMMLTQFGDQYREYMKETGAVIPKL